MAEEKNLENTEERKNETMTEEPDTVLYDRLYAEVSGEESIYGEKKAEESAGKSAGSPWSDQSEEEKKTADSEDEPEKTTAAYESGQERANTGWEYDPGKNRTNTDPEPEPVKQAARGEAEGKRYTPRFFSFFSREPKFSREQAVLSRIDDAHLMDYLSLEQKRYESEQKLRDERGKRILSAFQLAVSLAAIVAVIGFLKDEPTVLVNILYIIGIIAAVWLWKTKK